MSQSQQQRPSDEAGLLRAFSIQAQDVEANRAGALGPNQVRRLRNSAALNVVGALIIVGGLAAVLLLVAAKPLVWYQYLLSGLLAAGGAAAGWYTVRGILRSIREGTVERLSGQVTVRSERNNGWWLTVQGRSFRLPVHFWHVANQGYYRVYVAPAAKRIVAMEFER